MPSGRDSAVAPVSLLEVNTHVINSGDRKGMLLSREKKGRSILLLRLRY